MMECARDVPETIKHHGEWNMSWYNPNSWSPDGKAVFVNILIGAVIFGLELLRQWQEENGEFDGRDEDLWR